MSGKAMQERGHPADKFMWCVVMVIAGLPCTYLFLVSLLWLLFPDPEGLDKGLSQLFGLFGAAIFGPISVSLFYFAIRAWRR